MRPGQVMDNLPTPKCEEVDELIEASGCELLFVAPCSPGYNPVEEAFSKIEALLRKGKARTRGAPIGVLGEAVLNGDVPEDARGLLEHRGYRRVSQPL